MFTAQDRPGLPVNKVKKELLILFLRNPEPGKVKTRLAATLGDEKALAIYFWLLNHTREMVMPLDCDKVVYYSDYIDTEDAWSSRVFQKSLQQGRDLGEKMMGAFEEGFKKQYASVCIIGSDCYELTSGIIAQAFDELNRKDVVVGPAHDGGYYLLGMKRLHREVFQNKIWSSATVMASTVSDLNKAKLDYSLLPMLRDIDEEKDLPEPVKKLFKIV